MTLTTKELTLEQALGQAYARKHIDQKEFDRFKKALKTLLKKLDPTKDEENQKNVVADFLKDAYYKGQYDINTKDNIDLAIYTGTDSQSPVGVIIETKTPKNKKEMMTKDNLNVKALHQLVWYYFLEKEKKNEEISHLIATNIEDWLLFDAKQFKSLGEDKKLVAHFKKFVDKKLIVESTGDFYKYVEDFINKNELKIEFTHFNLTSYAANLESENPEDEAALIELYKILSPEHLLKLDYTNKDYMLDREFYNELLYIIGLTETGGAKKIIERYPEKERQSGAILEETIGWLKAVGRVPNVEQYGSTQDEQLFNIALELSITWINRILFLKLLEAQLISYHINSDAEDSETESYAFLSSKTIKNYGDLNSLFFRVLAVKQKERGKDVREKFEKVPYLNSTLFTPTELERKTFLIGNLKDRPLPVFPQTVLYDRTGKKESKVQSATKNSTTMSYLLDFLDAHDFGSESTKEKKAVSWEQTSTKKDKKLISAAVLGLIFEKINGHKDGSHYTPGFITMYMCRESIRKAVLQKFKDTEELKWDCTDIAALRNEIVRNKCEKKANEIINKIRICDPAVGSGHFLVSALNEIIALKSELGLLQERNGKLLDISVSVVNDELVIEDAYGKPFIYHHPNNEKIQRVQETLFHEKQTIIENCLFGVDINPNSVAICRLRLWIELLKNAYYKNAIELETLPNIDINIKCGNSLVSRFPLNADLKQTLKGKSTIARYRKAVSSYRNAKNKEQKWEMEQLVADIKNGFRASLQQMFSGFEDEKEVSERKFYEKANAIEWRFEFPEVLDDNGEFVGFDVVIGNPPYMNFKSYSSVDRDFYKKRYGEIFDGKADLLYYFIFQGMNIVNLGSHLSFITSRYWLEAEFATKLRKYISEHYCIQEILDFGNVVVFEQGIKVAISTLVKTRDSCDDFRFLSYIGKKFEGLEASEKLNVCFVKQSKMLSSDGRWIFVGAEGASLLSKITNDTVPLESIALCKQGIVTGRDGAFVFNTQLPISELPNSIIKPWIKVGDVHPYAIRPVEKRFLVYSNDIDKISDYPKYHLELKKHSEKLKNRREVKNGKIRWFDLQWAREKQFFDTEKLVCRFKAERNTFALDTGGLYCSADITIIILKEKFREIFNIKFILALLNSRLLDYHFKSYAKLMDYRYEYYPTPVGLLRIKQATEEEQVPIVHLVDKILSAKAADPDADTGVFEREIDRLVYALYDLTEEEIRIVEGGE